MVRQIFPVLLFACTTLALSSPAEARDLHARLGLGYNKQFSNSAATNAVAGISAKYGLTKDIALGLVFGTTTGSPANSVTAVKFFKNIFFETNLNFYFMLGAGLVSAGGNSGTEFLGGLGAEFFIPGVESLGLSFETGVSFNNASGSFALKTIGVSILDAGVHFYF